MAHCTSCGTALTGGEKFCGNCGVPCSSEQNPQVNAVTTPLTYPTPSYSQSQQSRHARANKLALIAILSVLGAGFLGIMLLGMLSKTRSGLPSISAPIGSRQDNSGWAGNYGCVSSGKSYMLNLSSNGVATLQGIHDGIWFESQQVGEPAKSDITVMGISDAEGKSILFNLHKSGTSMLTGHGIDITCTRR